MRQKLIILCFLTSTALWAQKVGILKYKGGGDWYANPTAVPNLIKFSNEHIKTILNENPEAIEVGSLDIYNYSILFMTGHGNVYFEAEEGENLRNYLISGGFLHISDNYGMDKYIRKELKKVFPNAVLQEVPYNHDIYKSHYRFEQLPKIHEHDGKAAQGFGIFYQGRMVLFYDYESDLSDGWEDPAVHNDPPNVRKKALQMGANIIAYAFKN